MKFHCTCRVEGLVLLDRSTQMNSEALSMHDGGIISEMAQALTFPRFRNNLLCLLLCCQQLLDAILCDRYLCHEAPWPARGAFGKRQQPQVLMI